MKHANSPFKIIKSPVITEKSSDAKLNSNKYSFFVDPSANKIQIKEAVEAAFSVQVLSVRTQNCKAKKKRLGRYQGTTASQKKAVVTLKEGNSIRIMEGP
jgi:large subunit ribosomal protein L23